MFFWRNLQQNNLMVVFLLLIILLLAAGCSLKQKHREDLSVLPEAEEEEEHVLEPEPEAAEEEASEEELEKEQEEQGQEQEQEKSAEEAAPAPQTEEQAQGAAFPVISDGDYLLALVGKNTLLKSSYVPAGLVPVPSHMRPYYSMQLRDVALENLELLFAAAATDGVDLSIRSAYRSYQTQEGLFKDYASRHGEKEANRFSARPGQSEHQLGTTVDFGGTAHDFSAAFAGTPQGIWLAENAFRFGFALSYPQGQEEVTGYIFEPWHFRYIGLEAALEWKNSGKTLVEYLEAKPQAYD